MRQPRAAQTAESAKRLKAIDVEAVEVKTVEVPLIPQGAAASDKDDYSIF